MQCLRARVKATASVEELVQLVCARTHCRLGKSTARLRRSPPCLLLIPASRTSIISSAAAGRHDVSSSQYDRSRLPSDDSCGTFLKQGRRDRLCRTEFFQLGCALTRIMCRWACVEQTQSVRKGVLLSECTCTRACVRARVRTRVRACKEVKSTHVNKCVNLLHAKSFLGRSVNRHGNQRSVPGGIASVDHTQGWQ